MPEGWESCEERPLQGGNKGGNAQSSQCNLMQSAGWGGGEFFQATVSVLLGGDLS